MKIKYVENGWVIKKNISRTTLCKMAIRDRILIRKQIRAYETEIDELKQQPQNIEIANKIFKLKMDIDELNKIESSINRQAIKISGNENFWRENNIWIAEYFYDERNKGE